MTRVLVTGTAGFIGFHLARHLLDEGFAVLGTLQAERIGHHPH